MPATVNTSKTDDEKMKQEDLEKRERKLKMKLGNTDLKEKFLSDSTLRNMKKYLSHKL